MKRLFTPAVCLCVFSNSKKMGLQILKLMCVCFCMFGISVCVFIHDLLRDTAKTTAQIRILHCVAISAAGPWQHRLKSF